jgi:hypothetical protein
LLHVHREDVRAGSAGKEITMAHHKRRKPKNNRSGCLMCKYWKMNHARRTWLKASERRRLQPDEKTNGAHYE